MKQHVKARVQTLISRLTEDKEVIANWPVVDTLPNDDAVQDIEPKEKSIHNYISRV